MSGSDTFVDDRDPSISYSGSWTQGGVASEFDGTSTTAQNNASSLTFHFTGSQVSVFGSVPPTPSDGQRTLAAYTIDDQPTVTLLSPHTEATLFKFEHYRSPVLAAGQHVLQVAPVQLEANYAVDYMQVTPGGIPASSSSSSSRSSSSSSSSAGSTGSPSSFAPPSGQPTTSPISPSDSPGNAPRPTPGFDNGTHHGPSTGTLIPAIAIPLCLLALALALFLLYRRRRQQRAQRSAATAPYNVPRRGAQRFSMELPGRVLAARDPGEEEKGPVAAWAEVGAGEGGEAPRTEYEIGSELGSRGGWGAPPSYAS